jgi:hypothetical protein
VREAAVDADREPSALGLEGHVRATAEAITRVPDRVARWRDAGADAVAVNPLRAGANQLNQHLDVLLRAAELFR